MDTNLAKVSQMYDQTQIKIVKVKTAIHSQVTLWRFKVIDTDPEGQHSDVDPLGQTPGQHLDIGLCIQGQGHSWRQSSQDRTHLSISRSTSAHKSVKVTHRVSHTGTWLTCVGRMWTHRALHSPPAIYRELHHALDLSRDVVKVTGPRPPTLGNVDMSPQGHSQGHRHSHLGRICTAKTKCPHSLR